MSISVSLWKRLLVAFAIAVCVFDLWALSYAERALSPQRSGTLGVAFGSRDGSGLSPIVQLQPDSPLAAAGAKSGDYVKLDRFGDRFRNFGVDETVGMTLVSKGEVRHLEVRPAPQGEIPAIVRVNTVLRWIDSVLFLVVGLLIGLRRPDDPAARALCLSLLAETFVHFIPLLPGGAVQTFSETFLREISLFLTYVCFIRFALSYPRDRPLLRFPAARHAFFAIAAGYAALATLYIAVKWSSIAPPALALVSSTAQALDVLSAALAVGALVIAWRNHTGVARQRLAWLALCTGGIYAAYLDNNVNALLGAPIPWEMLDLSGSVLIFAATCGLAYALLRHRVLDFGFAVNRALVYGTTSLVLAAAFIVFAQIANRFIHFEERQRSIFIDGAVALALALCGRQLARWIDPRVQRIFFRRWHESARQLERFRVDTLHDLDRDALIAAFADAIGKFSAATRCVLYLREGNTLRRIGPEGDDVPASLSADDALAVELEQGKRPVTEGAALRGLALALPMVVRNRLTGFVLLGAKPDLDAYRGDEIRLMLNTTQQLGLELELRRLHALEARGLERASAEESVPAGNA